MNLNNAGIYLITSKSSGKRYIGSAVRFDRRWATHRCSLKRGNHDNPELQNIYNKHGVEGLVFSVVEVVDRSDLSSQEFKELLLGREQCYIDNWNPEINVLKKAGSRLGHKTTDATKAKISASLKGRGCSDETRSKIGAAHKGKKLSEEHRSKLSAVHKGITLSEEHKSKIKEGNIGKRQPFTKGYYFNKRDGIWSVEFSVEGKHVNYGRFKTEEEAVAKAAEVKLILGGFD